ncbi:MULTISPECIES: Jag N-terminal domain-containing protein [Sulfurimonas]|uniref:Jag N-terminal domain-containing protein n=1 Tax=Sulfurimonas TaxID=202746 RepID=UPI0012650C4A|nr:Jag N-terminal domain-containing protein [Sulfurimonas indica]
MIKIEAVTLEEAYKDAAATLKCSVTEMAVEVVQAPSSGFLGLFKKPAIIVATIDKSKVATKKQESVKKEQTTTEAETVEQTFLNDTILPASFVSDQDEELQEDLASGLDYTADYDDAYDEDSLTAEEKNIDIYAVAKEVQKEINELFTHICFEIDPIEVSVYDEQTLLIEFKGEDAALLIGKEGYRYKALSYMLFNWINAKYDLQLRLEIAEFLQNQEESVGRYLEGVCESIDRDGRAQTKILDGVLVQIALKELRERYPQKYVVIRSTRDGLKYILVNDYHTN